MTSESQLPFEEQGAVPISSGVLLEIVGNPPICSPLDSIFPNPPKQEVVNKDFEAEKNRLEKKLKKHLRDKHNLRRRLATKEHATEAWFGKHPKRAWLNGINTKHFIATFLDKTKSPELARHQDKLEMLFSAALAYCEQKLDDVRKEKRTCPKCKTEKPMDSFRTNPTWCKTCLAEKEKKARTSVDHKIRTTNYQREYMRKYRAANPEREAKTVLKGFAKALTKKPEMMMTQHRGIVSLNENFENGRERSLAVASDLSPDEAMMLAEEMEAEENQ